jgi:ferric-dicitrate binding protein FerR (iron transport regulator)
MSESNSINNPNGELPDDKLFGMLSQLRVPPPKTSKEEAWDKLMLEVKREQRWDRLRIGFMRWGAAAVVLIVVSSILAEWQFSTKTFEAPFGKMAYVLLPDSSSVTLNSGSVIKHREFGFKRDRVVELKGEALFDVMPGEVDFMVIAGESTVRVLGTRFNVFHRDNILEVKCLYGEVEVKIDNMIIENLQSGSGISYSPKQAIVKKLSVDPLQDISWTKGEFYFTQAPLNLVIEELQRQFNVKIDIQGFDPHNRLYSGYFTNESISTALDLVCVPMGLMYEIDYKANLVRIFPAIK